MKPDTFVILDPRKGRVLETFSAFEEACKAARKAARKVARKVKATVVHVGGLSPKTWQGSPCLDTSMPIQEYYFTYLKRHGYKYGVEWIALNDEPEQLDSEIVSYQTSVCLLADLFDKCQNDVARDIVRYREKHHQ